MADNDSRSGARYAERALLDWVASTHAPHDAALDAAFDAASHGLPAIQVGPSEGKLLGLLLRLANAKRVVEVGTLAGYSAIWMARALPADGMLYSLEIDPKHAEVARANVARAGLSSRVEILVGDASESLAELATSGPYCAVFVDADKGRYDFYGRWAAANVRPGGLLIGDNAFFFGKLLDPADPTASVMRAFHEEMQRAFDAVCIPTPDGLTVGIRRG
jgi:predicted O-methyltransferase YrrM